MTLLDSGTEVLEVGIGMKLVGVSPSKVVSVETIMLESSLDSPLTLISVTNPNSPLSIIYSISVIALFLSDSVSSKLNLEVSSINNLVLNL